MAKSTATEGYVSVYAPGHPLAWGRGRVYQHRLVLFEAIGPGEHPCHWCGSMVEWMGKVKLHPRMLVVDHIDEDTRNNDLSNLAASCLTCNANRNDSRRRSDTCKRGHVYGPDNQVSYAQGRKCLTCTRASQNASQRDRRAAAGPCSASGCTRPTRAKGLCYRHLREE